MSGKLLGEEAIEFHGHPLVQATHRTTFEVTKEKHLSERGDCIIGVAADKACYDLRPEFKRLLADRRAIVELRISVGELTFRALARGHPSLILSDRRDMVVRKSRYICPRTLAIGSDKAAIDIPREIVRRLSDPKEKATMIISVHKKAQL